MDKRPDSSETLKRFKWSSRGQHAPRRTNVSIKHLPAPLLRGGQPPGPIMKAYRRHRPNVDKKEGARACVLRLFTMQARREGVSERLFEGVGAGLSWLGERKMYPFCSFL